MPRRAGRALPSAELSADQFFVRTATWGLERWEMELGIPTDRNKPIERGGQCWSPRGAGTFSGARENVAEAYDGGTVEVSFQPEEWGFTVKFVDTLGIPESGGFEVRDRGDQAGASAVAYAFNYLLIRDIHDVMTMGQLGQPLNKFAGGV